MTDSSITNLEILPSIHETNLPFQITKFEIYGLNGIKNIKCKFKDNVIILVGENGDNKTTVLSIFYITLSRQWPRLRKFKFDHILIEIDNREFTLRRATLFPESSDSVVDVGFDKAISVYIERNRIIDIIEDYNIPISLSREIGRSLDIPHSYVRGYLSNLLTFEVSSEVKALGTYLESLNMQVLYLPTYRRIEQDVRSIFPELAGRLSNMLEKRPSNSPNYIEFVEFGMDDVDRLIKNEAVRLQENLRSALVDLTRAYLSDVVSNNAKEFRVNRALIPFYVDMTRRMSKELNEFLNVKDLQAALNEIQQVSRLKIHHKISLHFVSKLLDVYANQINESENMRSFSSILDKYLSNKWVDYRMESHNLQIRLVSKDERAKARRALLRDNPDDRRYPEIDLQDFSSGEKQITSIFAHLFLSKVDRIFIIIDEPELSLSIPWQRMFLPDILGSAKVVGMLAVTHSPFTFDNDLDRFAQDIAGFTENLR